MKQWLRAHNIPLLLAVMALTVIVAGGFVRINDAGESCPDWPTCFGTLGFDVSEADQTTWYEATGDYDSRGMDHTYTSFEIFTEWFHRLLATGSGAVVIAGLFVVNKRKETLSSENLKAAKIALAVVIAQGALGAITVIFDNDSWSVVLHLIFALAYTAWLLYWWLIWLRDVNELPEWATLSPKLAGQEKQGLGIYTLGTLPVLLLGVWVATGEGGAFNQGCSVGWWQGWPLCQGELLPDIMANLAILVAWVHRVAVIIVAIWLVRSARAMSARLNGEAKYLNLMMTVATAGFMLNIVVGGLYVILAGGGEFPEWLSLVHLALGSDVVLLYGLAYTICYLNDSEREVDKLEPLPSDKNS